MHWKLAGRLDPTLSQPCREVSEDLVIGDCFWSLRVGPGETNVTEAGHLYWLGSLGGGRYPPGANDRSGIPGDEQRVQAR